MAKGGFPPAAIGITGLVVWAAVVLGLATGIFPRAEPPTAAIVAGLCLAAYAGLIALSMAWASDDGSAFEDAIRALAYLGVFVLVVVASPRESAGAWLKGLAIGLTAVGVIALLARFEPGPFGDPDADLAQTIPSIVGRLTYPVGYWNGLAAMMAGAITLLVWLTTASRTRSGRALAGAAWPVAALALWMSGSRGGVAAAVLAIAILVVTGQHRPRLLANLALGAVGAAVLILAIEARDVLLADPVAEAADAQGHQMLAITILVFAATGALRYALDGRLSRLPASVRIGRPVLVAVAVAAAIALVVANPVQQFEEFKEAPSAKQLASGERGLFRGGGSGRWQFWETATDAFASAPVEGVGASGYTPYWLEHREYPLVAKRAHSLLFETLAELGVLGGVLITGFFSVVGLAGLRRWRERRMAELGPAIALVAIGVAAAAVDWTWDLPAVFLPTVIGAALLTGPASLQGPDTPATIYGTVRSRRRFARGVAVLVVAWLSICGSGLLALADDALTSSREQNANGDLEGAIDSANRAIDLEPWAAEPRAQLALLYEQAGDLVSARAAIEQAIARSREDWELYLAAARIAQEAGDEVNADANIDRAAALNPLAQE